MRRHRPMLGLAVLHGLAMAWLVGVHLCLRVRDLDPQSCCLAWFRQPLALPAALCLLTLSLAVVLGLGSRPHPLRLRWWLAAVGASLLGLASGTPHSLAMALPAAALFARATTSVSRDLAQRRGDCAALVAAATLVPFAMTGPAAAGVLTPLALAGVLLLQTARSPRPIAASLSLPLTLTPAAVLLLLSATPGWYDCLVVLGVLLSLTSSIAALCSPIARTPALIHASALGLALLGFGLGEPGLGLQGLALGALAATALAFGLLPCERIRRRPKGAIRRRRFPTAMHTTTLAAALIILPLPGAWWATQVASRLQERGAAVFALMILSTFVILAGASSRARRETYFRGVHTASPPTELRPSPRDHRASSFDVAILAGGALSLAVALDSPHIGLASVTVALALSLAAGSAWIAARHVPLPTPHRVVRAPSTRAPWRAFRPRFPHRAPPWGATPATTLMILREFLIETAAPLTRPRILQSSAFVGIGLAALLLWLGRSST